MNATDRPSATTLRMDPEALSAFLEGAFPKAARRRLGEIVSLAPGHVRVSLEPDEDTLRPGGIVSGPTLMGLVDVSAYAVVLAHIGPVAMAVTNTLNMNFLRPCRRQTILSDARLLRLGRRFASVDVRIWQSSEDELVAQSTVGYAIPDAAAG